jgi:hypothetical protein
MTKPLRLLPKHSKSPIRIIGLFCLLLLISACNRTDNPDDVTVIFWTALAENNLEKAQHYSTAKIDKLFNPQLLNASVQVGKTQYECYKATVQTYLNLRLNNRQLFFKTVVIRDDEKDVWIVDYKNTLANVNAVLNVPSKDILTHTKQLGQQVTADSGTFLKSLWQSIKDSFKLFKQWLLN